MLHGGLSDRTLLHPLMLNFLLLLKKNRTSATHDNIWHIVSVQLELGWQNKHIKMLDYTMQRRASSTTKCDKVGTIHSEYQEGTKGNTGTALYSVVAPYSGLPIPAACGKCVSRWTKIDGDD